MFCWEICFGVLILVFVLGFWLFAWFLVGLFGLVIWMLSLYWCYFVLFLFYKVWLNVGVGYLVIWFSDLLVYFAYGGYLLYFICLTR